MTSSGEQADDAAFAEALTHLWRVGRKLSGPEPDPAVRAAARHLRTACEALAQVGLSVQDHDGVVFDAGMALEVIAYEPRPDLRTDTVLETVRPCVYRGERRIQVGQVIVARPDSGKLRKGRRI